MKVLCAWLSAAFIFPLLTSWAWQPDGWVHTTQSSQGALYAYSWEEKSWYYFDPAGVTWVYHHDQDRWQRMPQSAVGSSWSYWHWPYVWSEGYWHYCRSAGVQWVYDFETGGWGELGEVLPKQILPALKDYYPHSGPAGATVYVRFNEPVSGLAQKVRAYYAGAETQVSQTGKDVIAVQVPADAVDGEIVLVSGRSESAALPFAILERVDTPLLTETIGPSTDTRTYAYNDEVSVTVPAGMVKSSSILSIARVANAPTSSINPFGPFSTYEISLGDLEALDVMLEIGIRYDPALLDPAEAAAAQLMVLRWDEELGDWIPLPQRVDTEDAYIYAYTDHLSLFGVLAVGALRSMAVSWVGEKVLNYVYVTPMGNFRILYSRPAMDQISLFSDFWKQNRPEFSLSYQTKYPEYIQDIGHLFEVALANFRGAGFKIPQTSGRAEGYLTSKEWKNPITVKIDSNWSKIIGIGTSDPQYEKIWQNIHLPTGQLMDYRGHKSSYAVLGHELFHRIQAEYYGRTGFLRKSNYWWLEATAEYAGSRAAWAEKLDYLHRDIGASFLSYPITTTGPKWREKLYEYAASVFVQFLVEVKGLDFHEMVADVAAGEPVVRLSELIASKGNSTLGDYYAEFAAWAVFSQNSFLRRFPIADFSKPNTIPNEIAGTKDTLELAAGDGLVIEVSGGNPVFVDRFRLGEGERVAANTFPYPLDRLSGGQTGRDATAKAGDVLYFLAVNPGTNDLSTTVSVRVDKNQGPELSHTFNLRGQYSAKLWAVRILGEPVLTVVPAEIAAAKAEQEIAFTFTTEYLPEGLEWVYYDWDFGDLRHNSKGKSTRIAVVAGPNGQGKVQHEVNHAFAPDKGEYTAVVVLRDFNTNRELARATVDVTLYQVRIEGGVRHFVYELPPGVRELQHAFQASASPAGNYRFEWDFGDGQSMAENKGPGERSSVSHTYTNLKDEDAFHPRVRLRGANGDVLAEDVIHIKIFAEAWDEGRPLLTAVEPVIMNPPGSWQFEVYGEAAPVGSLIRISGENLPTASEFGGGFAWIEIGGVQVPYHYIKHSSDGSFQTLWLTAVVPEFNALYGDVVVYRIEGWSTPAKSSNRIPIKTSLDARLNQLWSHLHGHFRWGEVTHLSPYHEPFTIEWFRDGVLVETGTFFSNRNDVPKPTVNHNGPEYYHDFTHITVVVTDALGRVFTATHTKNSNSWQ